MGNAETGQGAAAVPARPELWVDEHGDVLYRYALVRVREPDAAETIVQETLLAALESRDTFSGKSSVRTWLLGILKHKLMDHFRKSSREVPCTVDSAEEAEEAAQFKRFGRWKAPPQPWHLEPDTVVQATQFWQYFEKCLHALSPGLAQAFILRELDGVDSKEICKVMAVSPTNLGVMMHRARARLRRCLEREWFVGSEVKP